MEGRPRWSRSVALAVVLAVLGTSGLLVGCTRKERVAVRAVTLGVVSESPFFRTVGLGLDVLGVVDQLGGGQQSGGAPGVFGGTRMKGRCDKARLVSFLKDAKYARQAAAWTDVLGVKPKDIEKTVKRWTPVLLRNDTLVKNHDFKNGKASGFTALLQAGIAVLVDAYGQPVVQCSCGNPLRAYDRNIDKIDIDLKVSGRNKKWKGYDRKKAVQVKPADKAQAAFELVDVTEQGAGIERPQGSTGGADETLPTDPAAPGAPAIPDVVGQSADQARQTLEDAGFTVRTQTDDSPEAQQVEPGQVLRQDPEPGSSASAGAQVTLYLAPQPGDAKPAACSGAALDFTAYPALDPGATGDAVTAAQCLLAAAGHDPGPVDGDFGPSTAAAVQAYQAATGLQALGRIGPRTWTALLARGDTPDLQVGSGGEAVSRLQRALTVALDRTVVIDGDYGPVTEQAVRDYQGDHKLDATGSVDPDTWASLQSGG
ncbi:peptidoglycan-binding protein [Streptomyces sp. NBC_00433]